MFEEHKETDALRKMAAHYAEQYGSELLDELAQLEKNEELSLSERRVERRVKSRIAAQKRGSVMRGISILAACLVLAIMLPRFLNMSKPQQSSPADEAPPVFDIIPLAAELPAGFRQSGFRQDEAKSIYYIEDALLDDVVISLEKSALPPETDGLVEISLGRDAPAAYGTQTDGYSLLVFSRDDVVYTMTCRYDINTLIRLGKGLVIK